MNSPSDATPNSSQSTQTNADVGESFSREAREEPLVETIEETVGYAPPPTGSHAGERTKAQAEAEAQAEAAQAQDENGG